MAKLPTRKCLDSCGFYLFRRNLLFDTQAGTRITDGCQFIASYAGRPVKRLHDYVEGRFVTA